MQEYYYSYSHSIVIQVNKKVASYMKCTLVISCNSLLREHICMTFNYNEICLKSNKEGNNILSLDIVKIFPKMHTFNLSQ